MPLAAIAQDTGGAGQVVTQQSRKSHTITAGNGKIVEIWDTRDDLGLAYMHKSG